MITLDNLLSGLIGAFLASLIAILFQYWFDKKQKEYLFAKERLEKIYGPLLLIYETNKGLNGEKFQFIESEEKYIDELILKNYYLIEENKRDILIKLYSYKKFSEGLSNNDIIIAIKKGYEENFKKLK